MALAAVDLTVDMGRVIEISEFVEMVDPLPNNRLVIVVMFRQFFNPWMRDDDSFVTEHARFNRRYTGISRSCCLLMAHEATDFFVTGVYGMTEGNRLAIAKSLGPVKIDDDEAQREGEPRTEKR